MLASVWIGMAMLVSANGFGLYKAIGRRTGADMPPISCTAELSPVCGDNGQMYANRCLMEGAGVAEGNTGCNCSCPMTYKKVLGEDNKWYMNKCVMECAGVRENANSPQFCITTLEWFPVCGINGKTYGNRGSMRCAGIDEAYPGNCTCSCHGYGEAWVCGRNGLTYYNICQLSCSPWPTELAYSGRCVYDSNNRWVPNGNAGVGN